MKSITQTLMAFGLLVAGFTTTASADTYHHIDELACHIARQSECLVDEVRFYRHTPEYRYMVEDARDLHRFADHLHEIALKHGSLSLLESDIRRLDSKFHHFESVFNRAERNACRGGGRGYGNTPRVRELLHSIEDDIHHLREDLRELRRSPYHLGNSSYRISAPTIAPPRVTPPHPHRGFSPYQSLRPSSRFYDGRTGGFSNGYNHPRSAFGGRSISIGGGSSRLTFSF